MNMRNISGIVSIALSIISLAYSFNAVAGGVSLGATRVIYSAKAKQASLTVSNTDKTKKYLIQGWVEDDNGGRAQDFVVTPPLFVSNPSSENTLRLVFAGTPPVDREKVYWINVKAIPSVDKSKLEGKNVLQLAILSRIKLFVRPDTLDLQSSEAPSKLTFSLSGNNLSVDNPTPYYISMVNLSLAGKTLPNTMVPPKQKTDIAIKGKVEGHEVTFSTVNDYGATTPAMTYQAR